jgi:hypothetical protein
MCASDSQNQIGDEQSAFYKDLLSQDQTTFGEFQSILPQITGAYAPILAAGPNQNGFSAGETNDLNTQATEGVSTNYRNASQALNETEAARGGGDTYLPSGVNSTENESLLSSAAQQQSNEQLQIKQAGYAQGAQNFQNATAALTNEQSILNPQGAASTATSGGTAASNTAAAISSENNSWEAPLIGAAGAVGSAALTGGAKPPCWIAAEIFGGWYEPRTIEVREWLLVCFADQGGLRSRIFRLYTTHGEGAAAAIRRHRSLRAIFTLVCHLALRQARKWKNKWTL